MATHTTYYNLTKPSANDKVNIGVLNDNADIIDTALHNKVNNDDTQNITTSANKCMMSDGVTSVEEKIGNMRMVKLWENPSPSASFAAQNITDLPLSDYDIIVYVTGEAGGFNSVNNRHIIGSAGSSASVNYVFRRTFTPNGSTGVIAVSECIGFKLIDGTQSTFNTLYIPIAIYGIKLT